MYQSEDLKVLLGNSIPEPEVDYDDEMVSSETGYPVEESALKQYYFVTVTDSMGTTDFRSNYGSVIDNIRKMLPEDQQLLANSILQRLNEVYEFELYLNATAYNIDDINEIYSLIEFIEYNHEDFISGVWGSLNINENNFQIEKYCEQNKQKVVSEIEIELDSHDYSEMIAIFLRTYNKEKLIEWFCEKSKNLYTTILLNKKGVSNG